LLHINAFHSTHSIHILSFLLNAYMCVSHEYLFVYQSWRSLLVKLGTDSEERSCVMSSPFPSPIYISPQFETSTHVYVFSANTIAIHMVCSIGDPFICCVVLVTHSYVVHSIGDPFIYWTKIWNIHAIYNLIFKGKTGFVIYVIHKILETSSTIYWNIVFIQICEIIVLIIHFSEMLIF
jgi:hypothetical protein